MTVLVTRANGQLENEGRIASKNSYNSLFNYR